MDFTILSIAIPNTIPLPRYRLFQRVRVHWDDYPYIGEILGLEWATDPDGLTQWLYVVRPLTHAPPLQPEETESMWESRLSLDLGDLQAIAKTRKTLRCD